MADISIIISAVNNAQAALQQVSDQVQQLGTTAGSTTQGTDQLSASIGGVMVPLYALRQATSLVTDAFKAQEDEYVRLYTAASTLAEGEKYLMLQTGATADEAGKLNYTSQVLGVSTDDLAVAMNFALKRGTDVSIEGMSKLADEYNSIQDPITRSTWLLTNFGRSGQNIAPLLAQGAAGLQSYEAEAERLGVVLNDTSEKMVVLSDINIQKLTLAWQGLEANLGVVLVPLLLGATGLLTDLIAPISRDVQAVDSLANEFSHFYEVIATHGQVLRDQATALGTVNLYVGDYAARVEAAVPPTDDLGDSVKGTDLYLGDYAARMDAAGWSALGLARNINGLDTPIKSADGMVNTITDDMISLAVAEADGTTGADDLNDAIQALKDKKITITVVNLEEYLNELYGGGPKIPPVTSYPPNTQGSKANSPSGTASGGPLTGLNIVGEEGYELILGNRVFSHAQSVAMLEAGLMPGMHLAAGNLPSEDTPYFGNSGMLAVNPVRPSYGVETPGGGYIPFGGSGGARGAPSSGTAAVTAAAQSSAQAAQATSEAVKQQTTMSAAQIAQSHSDLQTLIAEVRHMNQTLPGAIRDAVLAAGGIRT
ncbi:MAG: hypothetical protein ABSG98_11320 [Anaerolineales bacterium]|jgi:hypothetical protein